MDNNLEMSLLAIQSDLSGLVSKATTLRTLAERAQSEADAALAYAAAAEEASALLMGISDGRTNALAQFLGGLVTEALRAIFDDVEGLTFVVSTRVLRGNLAVEFALESQGPAGPVLRPVLGSHGGGVTEVVAFVLRVSVAYLRGARFLVLDEPFARVSAGYRPRLAAFVREVVDRLGLKLLIVTHDDELPLVADDHYVLSGNAAGATITRNGG